MKQKCSNTVHYALASGAWPTDNMILFLLLIVATANTATCEQNTTEPPLVPYVEAEEILPSTDEGSPLTSYNNVRTYSGDAIIIELDPDGGDIDEEEEDRFMAEYNAENDTDNSTDIGVDRPTPEGEGEDRIINGYFARNGWFPMKARIYPQFQSGGVSCGGTIIASYWVLTAAHCLRSSSRGSLTAVPMIVGSVHVRSGGQRLNAIRAFVHPSYQSVTRGYDVALLKSRQRILFNRNTGTQRAFLAGLPNIRPGTNLYTAGWGRTTTQPGSSSDWLKYAVVRVRSCPSGGYPSNSLVCVVITRDRTCYGDSGGFLGNFRNGHWVVDGITSFGPSGCPSSGTDFFTSVAYFQRWIINMANNN